MKYIDKLIVWLYSSYAARSFEHSVRIHKIFGGLMRSAVYRQYRLPSKTVNNLDNLKNWEE